MTAARAGESMNCPLCENPESGFLFEERGYRLARCAGCGLVRVDNPPSRKTLDELYSPEYYKGRGDSQGYYDYAAERAALVKSFRARLKTLKKHSPGGRLLDVGCAFGFLLAEARAMGWEPFGIDRSAFAVDWARRELRLENVFAGPLSEASLDEGSFDAVTMIDTLEHFTDPRGEMNEIARLLKPGGVLLLDTWDIASPTAILLGKRWPIIAPPDHLFYFNPRTVTLLLEKSGMEVIDIERMGRHMSLASASTKLPAGFPLRERVIAAARRFKTPLPVNLHDNLLVIARRAG